MTAVAEHETHHAPPPRTGIRRWTGPGWLRVLWTIPLFSGIGFAIVCGLRWIAGWDPVWLAAPVLTVQLVTIPIGFLVGLGGIDSSADYASGKKTRPEDHTGHGADT